MGQGHGQGELHHHAPGEGLDLFAGGDFEPPQVVVVGGGLPALVDAAQGLAQLFGVHLWGEEPGVQHHAHLLHHGAAGSGVLAQQADGAAVGTDEAQHGLDGGAFARAVLADEAHNAAHRQRKADVVQCKFLVFFAEVPQFHCVFHRYVSFM